MKFWALPWLTFYRLKVYSKIVPLPTLCFLWFGLGILRFIIPDSLERILKPGKTGHVNLVELFSGPCFDRGLEVIILSQLPQVFVFLLDVDRKFKVKRVLILRIVYHLDVVYSELVRFSNKRIEIAHIVILGQVLQDFIEEKVYDQGIEHLGHYQILVDGNDCIPKCEDFFLREQEKEAKAEHGVG